METEPQRFAASVPAATGGSRGAEVRVDRSAPQAEGGLFTSASDLPEIVADDALKPLAVDAAGEVLLSASTPTQSLTLAPERIGILAPDASGISWIRSKQAPDRATQAWLGDLDAHWAVWAEGTSTQLEYLDSTIYAMRRSDGTITQLARSVLAQGHAVSLAGYNRPQIVGDRLVWQDIRSATDLTPTIYSRALDGHDAIRVERVGALFAAVDRCSAGGPASAGSFVYQSVARRADGAPGPVHLMRGRIGTSAGADSPVPGATATGRTASWQVQDVALCGATVAYVAGSPDGAANPSVDVVVLGARVPGGRRVLHAGQAGVAGLQLSPGYVAFGTFNTSLDGGQWIDDLGRGVLLRLPRVEGRQNVLLAGKHLVYVSPRTAQWSRLRVASLP